MKTGERLRVALLTTAFPRWATDGRAPWILHTARALRELGTDVRVITLHGPNTLPYEVIDGIPVHRIRYLWPDQLESLQDFGGGLPLAWRAGWLHRLGFLPLFLSLWMAAIRHGRSVDLIHAHWTLAGIAAWMAGWFTRTPFVLTVHGSDIYVAPKIAGIAEVTRRVLRRARHVLAASSDMAIATSRLGLARDCVEVLPYGVELERFSMGSAQREPLVLFVGSLIKRKGVHHLLAAMPEILKKCSHAHLVIVGEGDERHALEEQALSLGIGESVFFAGQQTRDEVATWMCRARVFVLPSLEEAFGVVLLEALASGTPCVASQIGGIVDVVSPDTGTLVEVGDTPGLAQAIAMLLTDDQLWLAKSVRARQSIEENGRTWIQVARRLVDIYATVSETRLPG